MYAPPRPGERHWMGHCYSSASGPASATHQVPEGWGVTITTLFTSAHLSDTGQIKKVSHQSNFFCPLAFLKNDTPGFPLFEKWANQFLPAARYDHAGIGMINFLIYISPLCWRHLWMAPQLIYHIFTCGRARRSISGTSSYSSFLWKRVNTAN